MSYSFLVRKWHKWLALIVGLQAVLWLVSGVYMVTVDLDYIHGDQLVQNIDEPITVDYDSLRPFSEMQQRYPDASKIRLVTWVGSPTYRIYENETVHIIDAISGDVLTISDETTARRVAEYHYAKEGSITQATLFADRAEVPSEIQFAPLPLWQISFDDAISTKFYISPNDGRLVTRRHSFWRGFDFLWMLHIMDYENRSDVNNNLFRIAAIFGTLLSLAGFWLLFYSFNKRKPSDLEEGEKS